MHKALICSGVLFCEVISVLTKPGATALTSTLYLESSTAAAVVKPFTPAFAMDYIILLSLENSHHMEAKFTILPYLFAFI